MSYPVDVNQFRKIKIEGYEEPFDVRGGVTRQGDSWQATVGFAEDGSRKGRTRVFTDRKYGDAHKALAAANEHALYLAAHPGGPAPRYGEGTSTNVRWTKQERYQIASRAYLHISNGVSFSESVKRAQDECVAAGVLAPERQRRSFSFPRSQLNWLVEMLDDAKAGRLNLAPVAQPKPQPEEPEPSEEPEDEPEEEPEDEPEEEPEDEPEEEVVSATFSAGDCDDLPPKHRQPAPAQRSLRNVVMDFCVEVLQHREVQTAVGAIALNVLRSPELPNLLAELLSEVRDDQQARLGAAQGLPDDEDDAQPQFAPPRPPEPVRAPQRRLETATEQALREASERKVEEQVRNIVPLPAPQGPKPRVLVLGVNPRQKEALQREFGEAVRLEFFFAGDPSRRLREIAPNCDYALSTFSSNNEVHTILAARLGMEKNNGRPVREHYYRCPNQPHAVHERLLLIARGNRLAS